MPIRLIIVVFVVIFVISSCLNNITSYFTTLMLYLVKKDKALINMNNKNSVIIYNIPIEKVQTGDTEIGYKMLAKVEPIFNMDCNNNQ
jgi:hypothetical protein